MVAAGIRALDRPAAVPDESERELIEDAWRKLVVEFPAQKEPPGEAGTPAHNVGIKIKRRIAKHVSV